MRPKDQLCDFSSYFLMQNWQFLNIPANCKAGFSTFGPIMQLATVQETGFTTDAMKAASAKLSSGSFINADSRLPSPQHKQLIKSHKVNCGEDFQLGVIDSFNASRPLASDWHT